MKTDEDSKGGRRDKGTRNRRQRYLRDEAQRATSRFPRTTVRWWSLSPRCFLDPPPPMSWDLTSVLSGSAPAGLKGTAAPSCSRKLGFPQQPGFIEGWKQQSALGLGSQCRGRGELGHRTFGGGLFTRALSHFCTPPPVLSPLWFTVTILSAAPALCAQVSCGKGWVLRQSSSPLPTSAH